MTTDVNRDDLYITLDQIDTLMEDGAKFEFFAVPHMMEHGFYVLVRKVEIGMSHAQHLATTSKPEEPRLFKSLDTVYSLLVGELKQPFTVEVPLRDQMRETGTVE